jgi:hypothetical protein
MEIALIGLVILLGGAIIYFNRSKGLDVNSDGKVDVKDASAAVSNTVEGVKAVADVNHDGKVNTADVKEAVVKTKAAAKKTATKVKAAAATATKKPGRKPKTAK